MFCHQRRLFVHPIPQVNAPLKSCRHGGTGSYRPNKQRDQTEDASDGSVGSGVKNAHDIGKRLSLMKCITETFMLVSGVGFALGILSIHSWLAKYWLTTSPTLVWLGEGIVEPFFMECGTPCTFKDLVSWTSKAQNLPSAVQSLHCLVLLSSWWPVGIGWDFHALGPLLCAWCVQWVVLVSGQSRLLPSPSHNALSGTGGIPITQETWQLWSKFFSPVDPSLDTGIWRTSILQTSPINNLDLNSGQNSSMPQS